jgi:transcription termination factor Rho
MSDEGSRPPRRRGGRGRGRGNRSRSQGNNSQGNNGGRRNPAAAVQEAPTNWEPGSGEDVCGILELTDRGGGFLRQRSSSFLPGDQDIFVPQSIIQRYKLRPGDEIDGEAGPPRGGKAPALALVTKICGLTPEECEGRREFSRLSAMHPNERLTLAPAGGFERGADVTPALIDLLVPLGKGQHKPERASPADARARVPTPWQR